MRGQGLGFIADVAPSSDPSGHLLPGGEKKQAATLCLSQASTRLPLPPAPPVTKHQFLQRQALTPALHRQFRLGVKLIDAAEA